MLNNYKMNFIKAETPKRNENDLKIIAEIDVLQEKMNRISANTKPSPFVNEAFMDLRKKYDELFNQFSLGYIIQEIGLINLPINLDHVVTYEKYNYLYERLSIPQIRFETVRGDKFLTFASEKERDTLHFHIYHNKESIFR